ncbi:MAG: IclR family transcriptional regulator [Paracoccaceae bacterium]
MSTIDKAFHIVRQFTLENPHITLAEMVRLSGFDKTTTRRLLMSLTKNEILEKHPSGTGYQLGTLPLQLSRIRRKTSNFDQSAEQVLSKLVSTTNESAHIVVLSQDGLKNILVLLPNRATHVSFDEDEDVQVHATASGMCFLAFSSEAEVDKALSQPLAKLTSFTETSSQKIRVRLPEIRESASVVMESTREEDVSSIASPFFNGDGAFLGAISIAVPANRASKDAIAALSEAVRQSSKELTLKIGGVLPI